MVVNEESTAWLTVTFKDREGNNEEPSSVEYRIDSSLGVEILGWTTITNPTAVQEIILTPDNNKIVDNRNTQENIITFIASFGADDKKTEEFKYRITNFSKIPKDD